MAYLWGGMILIGVLYGMMTGNLHAVTSSLVGSSREAIDLCITMAGITALWTGIMKIAETTGLVAQLSKAIRPVLKFLFPQLDPDSRACSYISLNFLSNLLGLSWASTSSGLLAFRELDKINRQECADSGDKCDKGHRRYRGVHIASPAMCTFLIINVSSLQLIPMSMIAYRAQYGSAEAAAIVGPAILATGINTLVAVVFCKVMERYYKTKQVIKHGK